MAKVKKALFMFIDLFGLEKFDYNTLVCFVGEENIIFHSRPLKVRFFITVKKNYRAVAYHNWTHGFHVGNSVYSILKATPNVFKPLEVSMLIDPLDG